MDLIYNLSMKKLAQKEKTQKQDLMINALNLEEVYAGEIRTADGLKMDTSDSSK